MKKNKKYSYIVDLIDVDTPADLMARFADAKQRAGLPIRDDEFNGLIMRIMEISSPKIYVCGCMTCECKKLPWYKRLWNKLRGKKNK